MVLSVETTNGATSAPLSVTGPVPLLDAKPSRNPFPPIADYGFLSDCENNCLVSSHGSVEWMCVPRPDSPSVFGAILDRSARPFPVGARTGLRCRRRVVICPAA